MARRTPPRAVAGMLAAGVVAFVLLAGSGSAGAAAGPKQVPTGPITVSSSAQLGHGYSIDLRTTGSRIRLGLDHDLFAGVQYEFHGRVTPAGIRARIGNRGVVELDFRPSGKTKRVDPPRNCSGPRSTVYEGIFVGTLKLRGEAALPTIDRSRLKGAVISPGWRCHGVGLAELAERAPPSFTLTDLAARTAGVGPELNALATTSAEKPGQAGNEVTGALQSNRDGVKITRFAATLSEGDAFVFDESLSSATIAPPAPFTGSADYCRDCGPKPTLTGDLRVRLPGLAKPVALTGRDFHATLRRLQGDGNPGAASAGTADSLPLIRGGTATRQGDLPALAFIAYLIPNREEAVTCTGTVITPRLVLTAAHCVDIRHVDVETENFRVFTGGVKWTKAGLLRGKVVRTMVAPGYRDGSGRDDAALLELETPVTVPPITLARRPFWSGGTEAEMAGWGEVHPGEHRPTYRLHRAPTALLSFTDCREEFGLPGQLCAEQSPPQRTSACYGDSGGPLLAHRPGDGRLVEIGVLHGGQSVGCSPRYASTYTSILAIHSWVQARVAEARR